MQFNDYMLDMCTHTTSAFVKLHCKCYTVSATVQVHTYSQHKNNILPKKEQ